MRDFISVGPSNNTLKSYAQQKHIPNATLSLLYLVLKHLTYYAVVCNRMLLLGGFMYYNHISVDLKPIR